MVDRIQGEPDPNPTDAAAADEMARVEAAAIKNDAGTPEEYSARLRAQRETFEKALVGLVSSAKDTLLLARDGRNVVSFMRDYDEEVRSYENGRRPTLTTNGEIDDNDPYRHLLAGTTLGLFQDAVNTAAAWLLRETVGGGKYGVEFSGYGVKDENDQQIATAKDLHKSYLERAKFIDEWNRDGTRDPFRHGAVSLRQEWVELSEWQWEIPLKKWTEKTVYRGPSIKRWPLCDVLVGDIACPNARDQRMVIWISRKTLAQLQANERRWENDEEWITDQATGQMTLAPRMALRGRFINLEKLREKMVAALGGSTASYSEDSNSASADIGTTNASGSPRVEWQKPEDFYECQSYLPIGTMIRSGLLSMDLLRSYGIDFSTSGATTLEGIARICDQVMWYVSVWGDQIVEFQTCPYKRQRNELLHAVGIPSEISPFYGLSFNAVAGDVEVTADQIHNSIIRTIQANGLNVIAGSSAAIDALDEAMAKIAKGGNSGNYVPVKLPATAAGVNVNQAISFLERNVDPTAIQRCRDLARIYEMRTMSPSLMKGSEATTESNTLGEADRQIQLVENRLSEILSRVILNIFVPMAENLLDDLQTFLSDSELEEEVMRVCGERGLDFVKNRASARDDGESGAAPHGVFDGIVVRPLGSMDIDKTVAISFMQNMQVTMASNPRFRETEHAIDIYKAIGLDGEKYFTESKLPPSPSEVVKLIFAGDTPKANEGVSVDAIVTYYLPYFDMASVVLNSMREEYGASGKDFRAIDEWLEVLGIVRQRYVDLAQKKMAAEMEQESIMAAAGMAAGGIPNQGGNPPNGQATQRRGIESGVLARSPIGRAEA